MRSKVSRNLCRAPHKALRILIHKLVALLHINRKHFFSLLFVTNVGSRNGSEPSPNRSIGHIAFNPAQQRRNDVEKIGQDRVVRFLIFIKGGGGALVCCNFVGVFGVFPKPLLEGISLKGGSASGSATVIFLLVIKVFIILRPSFGNLTIFNKTINGKIYIHLSFGRKMNGPIW